MDVEHSVMITLAGSYFDDDVLLAVCHLLVESLAIIVNIDIDERDTTDDAVVGAARREKATR